MSTARPKSTRKPKVVKLVEPDPDTELEVSQSNPIEILDFPTTSAQSEERHEEGKGKEKKSKDKLGKLGEEVDVPESSQAVVDIPEVPKPVVAVHSSLSEQDDDVSEVGSERRGSHITIPEEDPVDSTDAREQAIFKQGFAVGGVLTLVGASLGAFLSVYLGARFL